MLREEQGDLSPAGASHDRRGGSRGQRRRDRSAGPRAGPDGGAGGPTQGEDQLLDLGRQPWTPEDGHGLGRVLQQGPVLRDRRAGRHQRGDGGAEEGRRGLRGGVGARRGRDGPDARPGLLRQRDPAAGRRALREVAREGRLFPERGGGDAVQAVPASPLHAERHPALRALLPGRLVPGGEDRPADHLRRVHRRGPEGRQAPGAHRLRAAGRRLLRPPGHRARLGQRGGEDRRRRRQGRLRLARGRRRHRAMGGDVHEGQVGAGHRRNRPVPAAVRPHGRRQGGDAGSTGSTAIRSSTPRWAPGSRRRPRPGSRTDP